MDITPEIIVSIIGVIATSIVGYILSTQIKSQKDTIDGLKTIVDSMKSLNDMYNFDKIKSYAEIIEKEADGRYKVMYSEKFKEQLSKLDKEARITATERYLMKNADFIEQYEELASDLINFLLTKPENERLEWLDRYPKNKENILPFLEAIKRGEVHPGSSTDSNDSKPKNS